MTISAYSFQILPILLLLATSNLHANACYTSIIGFGDSLTDTGNLNHIFAELNITPPHSMYPPYGETFFNKPTGRFSNGRLIIDFIAEGLGLPLIPPSEDVKGNSMLGHGMNFAVAGATVMDSLFYNEQGVVDLYTQSSLGVQVQRFKDSLRYMYCTDCKSLIQNSLILMGEIGGNDYGHALVSGKHVDEIKWYIHLVVDNIASAITELIELGGKTFVVPGHLPIGCSPAFLTAYYGYDTVKYDNTTGCIVDLNKLSEYHNRLLQQTLNKIRGVHPSVNIIYGDYYNAAMQFYRSPQKYGFTNGALKVCCGGGGPYNYDPLIKCAYPQSSTCDKPDTYGNWDGFHLTEVAYEVIYKSLFEGTYTTPQFNTLCHKSVVVANDASCY